MPDKKDNEQQKFQEDLKTDAFKYGCFMLKNQKKDQVLGHIRGIGAKPIAVICLNEETGIKKKIDDSFVKSQIFNHKYLNIDIEYDSEDMKNLKYEQVLTGRNYFPIKGITTGGRFELG